MKVVLVMPLAEQRGGGELMLTQLLRRGRLPGVSWHVVFLEDGPMVEEARALGSGVGVSVVDAGKLRQVHRFVAAVRAIAAIIRREKADAVVGWMTKGHLYGSPAARLAGGVPAILYHLAVPTPGDWMDRIAARLPARGAITLSQDGYAGQKRLAAGQEVRIVYPGVDMDRFDPAILPTPEEARRRLGLPADGPLIGIVGRLQRWKGMHVLIEAMPEVLKDHPDARCVIVGGEHALEAEYAVYLKERIAALNLGEHVLLAGLQANVPEWMQAMDILIHASDHEPFGIVVIEAMALGKPLIAGSAGGPTEVITPGVNGYLSPFGDAGALAQHIKRLLSDPEQAARMGQAARVRAADFSTDRYARNLIDAVRDLINDEKQRTAAPASPGTQNEHVSPSHESV